ncbi:fructosamine kinase family protein [Balneola sp. MJW-20]|uniref:fructosamine kinase family protein n=1 Tax=Gracilimonas aurantiaca TaxID=3234185 RepID=UPI0034657150
MIPDSIRNSIESKLGHTLISAEPVSGGDINKASRVQFDNGNICFLKWNQDTPADMFEAEAHGLQLLRHSDCGLVIPEVLHTGPDHLLLNWITEGNAVQNSAAEMGRALARLHRNSSDRFGLERDNYIGRLTQSNRQYSNWFDFFAIERIEKQVQMGVESGKLRRPLLRKVQKLYPRLGHLFPAESPALLHGDLWSGNYMFTKDGTASIYDPATYYGHREMDLAMSRLFGGFPEAFYEGYNDAFPQEPGFEDRLHLYNLYPILVHANLFGSAYAERAESIIDRYV